MKAGSDDNKIFDTLSTLEDQSYKSRNELATTIFILVNGRKAFATAALKRTCFQSSITLSRMLAWTEVRKRVAKAEIIS